MTRERDRYGRASYAEQLGDLLGWFGAHPIALLAVAVVLGGIVVQIVAPQRSARPNDVAIGDCLFVPTSARNAIGPDARPIGELEEVARVLMDGGAEQASCTASHGHEVSGIVQVDRQPQGSENGAAQALGLQCGRAFAEYVGHDAIGSLYESLVVMPTDAAWATGVHRVICLVARRDGQWLTAPARASRQ